MTSLLGVAILGSAALSTPGGWPKQLAAAPVMGVLTLVALGASPAQATVPAYALTRALHGLRMPFAASALGGLAPSPGSLLQRGTMLGAAREDIWGQPLSANQVGPDKGGVIAFVDGSRNTGDPRNIVLGDHTVVQLGVGGQVVSPQLFEFVATNI